MYTKTFNAIIKNGFNSVLGSIPRLALKFTEQSKDLSMDSVLCFLAVFGKLRPLNTIFILGEVYNDYTKFSIYNYYLDYIFLVH